MESRVQMTERPLHPPRKKNVKRMINVITLFSGYDSQCLAINRLGTFIMNRQCSPVQRMKSLTSEQYTRKYKKEIGIYR